MPCVRVHLIDPSGDVLPYDHALAAALARRGVDVELVTSRFVHGPPPAPVGYGVSESFYRLATRLGDRAPRRRRAAKPAGHRPDMLGGGDRVHVIPHGTFEHLTRQRREEPLPPELAAVEGPVVLYFGVVRPYKGVDVLVEAFREVEEAELWVVG